MKMAGDEIPACLIGLGCAIEVADLMFERMVAMAVFPIWK